METDSSVACVALLCAVLVPTVLSVDVCVCRTMPSYKFTGGSDGKTDDESIFAANIGPTTPREAVVIYLRSNTNTNCIILSQLEDEPGVHHHCTRAHWPGQPLSY